MAGGHVALGVAVFSLVVGVSSPRPVRVGDGATVAVVRAPPRPTRNYECRLVVPPGPDRSPEIPIGGGMAAAGTSSSTRPITSGNVAVEIPPVVIVRAYGRRLSVTTNTGQPPNPSEAMYYIAKGRAGPADESTRDLVLSECSARNRR